MCFFLPCVVGWFSVLVPCLHVLHGPFQPVVVVCNSLCPVSLGLFALLLGGVRRDDVTMLKFALSQEEPRGKI